MARMRLAEIRPKLPQLQIRVEPILVSDKDQYVECFCQVALAQNSTVDDFWLSNLSKEGILFFTDLSSKSWAF